MKTNYLFAIAIAVVLAIFSCSKLDELLQVTFNINPNDIRFEINEITAANQSVLCEGTEYFNVDSLIKSKSNKLSLNNIKEAKVNQIDVKVLEYSSSKPNNSLKNLKTLKVELSTDNGATYEMIKELSNAEMTSDELIEIKDLNLDVLAKVKAAQSNGNNYKYRFTVSNINPTSGVTKFSAKLHYSIKAGL